MKTYQFIKQYLFISIVILLTVNEVIAQKPVINRQQELSDGWRFISSDKLTGCENINYDDSSWDRVRLPHTWQSQSDQSEYSNSWYRLKINVPIGEKSKIIYLKFEGASISTTVYINGYKLTKHIGAYTAFIVDLTDKIRFGEVNIIAVMCDDKKDVAGNLSRPLDRPNQYFCDAAGLHRSVSLIKTEPCHIDPRYYASSGIFVIPDLVNSQEVLFGIKTLLRNAGEGKNILNVRHTITDNNGNKISELSGTKAVFGRTRDSLVLQGSIANPLLWSPKSPNLYRIKTSVILNGKPVDSLETITGFRSLKIDSAGQFILNGSKIQLLGGNTHEVDEKSFIAVKKRDIDTYLSYFIDIGYNSVFLAHYPHQQYTLDQTDKKGLMAWVENGYVNGHYEKEISANIVREMIYQNWNHPSIFCWGVSNETFTDRWYSVHDLIKVAKSTGDSSRLYVVNQDKPNFADPILDFVGSSTFYGVFRKTLWENSVTYINQHGCQGVITHQQSYSDRKLKLTSWFLEGWYPEGYQQIIAEASCSQVYRENSPVYLFLWWPFREHGVFGKWGMDRGLVSYGGYKKDVFYLIKSFNQPEQSLVHICGKHWFIRNVNELKVYSNHKEVSIKVQSGNRDYFRIFNGKTYESKKNGDYKIDSVSIPNVFIWKDILQQGRNEIIVTGDGITIDTAVIYFEHGEAADKSSPVKYLNSSNGKAELINIPVTEQWPFYSQFDGNANNTWDIIPEIIKGTTWISTRRQSHPEFFTTINFTAASDIDVFIVVDALPISYLNSDTHLISPRWLTDQGFEYTGVSGKWRNHYSLLKDFIIMKRSLRSGEVITIHPVGEPRDWVCLLREI